MAFWKGSPNSLSAWGCWFQSVCTTWGWSVQVVSQMGWSCDALLVALRAPEGLSSQNPLQGETWGGRTSFPAISTSRLQWELYYCRRSAALIVFSSLHSLRSLPMCLEKKAVSVQRAGMQSSSKGEKGYSFFLNDLSLRYLLNLPVLQLQREDDRGVVWLKCKWLKCSP